MPRENTKRPSLIDTVQDEVGAESSALLSALTQNAKLIIAILLFCLLGLAAYWIYEGYADSKVQKLQKEYGDILMLPDASKRLQALKEFLQSAPSSFQINTYTDIIRTASELDDTDTTLDAWRALATLSPGLSLESTLAQASLLFKQGNKNEAVALLQNSTEKLKKEQNNETHSLELYALTRRLAVYAELNNDIPTALAAYTFLSEQVDIRQNQSYWQQKLIALEQRSSKTSE